MTERLKPYSYRGWAIHHYVDPEQFIAVNDKNRGSVLRATNKTDIESFVDQAVNQRLSARQIVQWELERSRTRQQEGYSKDAAQIINFLLEDKPRICAQCAAEHGIIYPPMAVTHGSCKRHMIEWARQYMTDPEVEEFLNSDEIRASGFPTDLGPVSATRTEDVNKIVRVCADCESEFGPVQIPPGHHKSHNFCKRHMAAKYRQHGMEAKAREVEQHPDDRYPPDLSLQRHYPNS